MNLNLKNKRAVVLGTGGAAKASIKALLDCGAIVSVVTRNKISAKKNLKMFLLYSLKKLQE